MACSCISPAVLRLEASLRFPPVCRPAVERCVIVLSPAPGLGATVSHHAEHFDLAGHIGRIPGPAGALSTGGSVYDSRGAAAATREGPVYMSRKIRKFWTGKFDTGNKRKF